MSESLSAIIGENLRLIFLFHDAIFDPLSSILDSHPSPLSTQHSQLSTNGSVLAAYCYLPTSFPLRLGFTLDSIGLLGLVGVVQRKKDHFLLELKPA
jgi:hypothetical protein